MAYLEYAPKSSLYHYTSPGGFEGMLASGQIWLTDLQYANDPKELQLAKVLHDTLSELADESEDEDWKRSCYKIRDWISRLRGRFGLYSFSLSEKADQLPMWQEYTDRGRGYCLRFRPTAFNKMTLRIQKVRYVNANFFSSLRSDTEGLVAKLKDVSMRSLEAIPHVTEQLTRFSSIKSDSWSHEDEVRLVFSSMARPSDFGPGENMFPIGLSPSGVRMFPKDPEYRMRGEEQVPYFAQNFGRFQDGLWNASSAISQVILGPNNDNSESAVNKILENYGYRNIEIVRSQCAFRP